MFNVQLKSMTFVNHFKSEVFKLGTKVVFGSEVAVDGCGCEDGQEGQEGAGAGEDGVVHRGLPDLPGGSTHVVLVGVAQGGVAETQRVALPQG